MKTQCHLVVAVLVAFFILIAVGCGAVLHSRPGTTTIVLIRHADRDEAGRLAPRGRERARSLVKVAGDMGIAAIYSPDLERNVETVSPLAAHLGVDITLTPKVSMPMVG